MKAIKLSKPGGLDKLAVAEVDARDPGPGEIRVAVAASSLNFHDYAVVSGMLNVADGRIPMSDGAGRVEAVGEGVTEFSVGDQVVSCFFPLWQDGEPELAKLIGVPGDHADGFAAQTVTMPARAFTRAPEGYSAAQAATLTCAALTAWRGLMVEARIKPGDVVLTQGTGGVSIFALQFAKAAGCRVISTSSSNDKLERLKSLGADELINYKETENWAGRALELTGGRGVDVVYDSIGKDTFQASLDALAPLGLFVSYGNASGNAPAVSPHDLQSRGSLFFTRPTLATYSARTEDLRAMADELFGLIGAGTVQVHVNQRYPLSDLARAHRDLEARATTGSTVLLPG